MTSDRYELRILGTPDLRAPDGRRVTSVLSQPSRLSLLSYLALAPGPVTRGAIVADFWPESDEDRARNALSQAVFYLRRSLGKDAVRGVEGDRLWVPPERVWCDARELLSAGDPSAEASALPGTLEGDLLAGWNAEGSQPLQEWLDTMRRRVRERAEELRGADAAAGQPRAPARAPGRSAPTPLADPAVPRARRWPRSWVIVAAAGGLSALVFAAVRTTQARAPGNAAASASERGTPPTAGASAPFSESGRLAVLLPRVTSSPGAPGLSELTLNDELIARMPTRDGLEVVSVPYARSLQDLTNQLAVMIGEPGSSAPRANVPDWILDVSVVVTADAVHVFSVVYSGAGFGVQGRDSFEQTFDAPEEMVIEVPRAIAERVAAMVEGEIGGN